MIVITNRKLDEAETGLDVFGKVPNQAGPNELRLVEVTAAGRGFRVKTVEDRLGKETVRKLIKKHNLEIDPDQDWFGSLEVACSIFEKARREKKHILFFVHGYNNDMKDVMNRCADFEKAYNVIVVAFSWPANGGGVEGVPAYLSDKRDARASADALDRTIKKIGYFHKLLTEGLIKRLKVMAEKSVPEDNPMAVQIKYAELIEKECSSRLVLLCHSMGNYVLKYALKPGNSDSKCLVFDTIALVAADANNRDHQDWVETLHVKNRLYIVINENDGALMWSRRKPGDEQLARLGHYLKNLVARNATYLNVTDASWVKDEHSYFLGEPIQKNSALKAMFRDIFEGRVAEAHMRFRPEGNFYELK